MTDRFLVVGPERHGVVRHVRRLAAVNRTPVARTVGDVPPGTVVHLDLTDRLLAPRWAAAELAGRRLFDDLDARGVRVVLGLHDVPDPADAASTARRLSLYRQLAERAEAVVACSDVEAVLLRSQGIRADTVIPLPVPAGPRSPASRRCESVTVLGYVWPGRGHEEVLAALPSRLPLICLGGPAPGHEDLAASLSADPRVHLTGFVPDAEIARRLTAATLPIAPNRALAASASICDWWAHGRRPLVPATPHTRELLARNPDSLLLYDELPGALDAARRDPGSTYLPPHARPGPGVADAAAERLAVGR